MPGLRSGLEMASALLRCRVLTATTWTSGAGVFELPPTILLALGYQVWGVCEASRPPMLLLTHVRQEAPLPAQVHSLCAFLDLF